MWLHGASVGEALSALPLIDGLRLRRPGVTVLFTTGTVTSASILESRLPPGVLHQFVPVDRMPWVDSFLDHWRPDLAVWLESELWPNTLAALAARRVPALLVNGRMSEASCGRWKRWAPATVRHLLATFAAVAGQRRGSRRFAVCGGGTAAVAGGQHPSRRGGADRSGPCSVGAAPSWPAHRDRSPPCPAWRGACRGIAGSGPDRGAPRGR